LVIIAMPHLYKKKKKKGEGGEKENMHLNDQAGTLFPDQPRHPGLSHRGERGKKKKPAMDIEGEGRKGEKEKGIFSQRRWCVLPFFSSGGGGGERGKARVAFQQKKKREERGKKRGRKTIIRDNPPLLISVLDGRCRWGKQEKKKKARGRDSTWSREKRERSKKKSSAAPR